MERPILRPVVWVGRAKKDFVEFPKEVQATLGLALYYVQAGEKEIAGAKPLSEGSLKGLGIFELVDDFDTDTYRTVYTTKLQGVVYVLHAFKKKSKKGISTPHHDVEVVRARYAAAVRLHEQRFGPGSARPPR
ncbi:MAG TPA: type II toxin-antitoxin system RelE/ParE family toxin [Longimicrobium sp.]|nr:type II toxin-antitoxin system RelE/ParE family toxin [Longimicrobium sp.]